jgi:hypothetical protein
LAPHASLDGVVVDAAASLFIFLETGTAKTGPDDAEAGNPEDDDDGKAEAAPPPKRAASAAGAANRDGFEVFSDMSFVTLNALAQFLLCADVL